MPYIRSANPNFDRLDAPSESPGYIHGAASKRSFIPVAFQVTSPYNIQKVLLPHALVMHVNPANFNETYTKKIERIQTKGGFVEQHWGDDLSEISGDGSTGAFMNIYTGLSSVLRRRTIAYDRYRDLHDLFRHNGSVYDPYGNIVLQGQIMLMFDRGTFLGTFRSFEFEETADSPFAFKINWSFKVEHIIYYIPGAGSGDPIYGPAARAPAFQYKNTEKAPNAVAQAAAEEKAATDRAAATRETVTQVAGAARDAWDRGSAAVKGFIEEMQKTPEQRTSEEQARQGAAEQQATTDSLAAQRREQMKNHQAIPIQTAPGRAPVGGK
jgi:hypothetical protein